MSYQNNNNNDGERNEVGALWKKKSKNGKEYLNGQVTVGGKTVKIVIFKNQFKKADNHPDYRILESSETNQGGGGTRVAGNRGGGRPQQTRQPQQQPQYQNNDFGSEEFPID